MAASRLRGWRWATTFLVVVVSGACNRVPDGIKADLDEPPFGSFEGTVVGEWLRQDGEYRDMKLREDFAFVDNSGRRWIAPAGRVINGASIPRGLWDIVGSPYDGAYREASVVHDVACDDKSATWQDVHYMFYLACKCGGLEANKAKVLFWAVWYGGPRWEKDEATAVTRRQEPPRPNLSEQEVRQMLERIEKENLSIDQLKEIGPDVI